MPARFAAELFRRNHGYRGATPDGGVAEWILVGARTLGQAFFPVAARRALDLRHSRTPVRGPTVDALGPR